jgi:N-methylhydantoinase A/oxoprolinase/acetone carboxylase beta subunit
MITHSELFLGIDTGGTFTDGVLLDSATRKVVKTAKVLTTHFDLSICVAEILEKLTPDDPAAITLVSLSTTLATNAIAEGKRKPVALLLLGYDPDLVHHYQFQHQFGTPHYYFIQGKYGLDGMEQIPLDEVGLANTVEEIDGKVEAFAIASYSGSRNVTHEERAGAIVASLTGADIVEAHHLSSELDSIRRATTASLNASLLSNTQEFLSAVQRILEKRKITCPVMMVRGDGSIVKAEYARKRPVEIIHSGPATSAIGGQFLSGADTALVIDMGGTTTDIALVENGKVQIEANAATVGPYRTCVKTIKVRSFGLGGDSLIRFDRSQHITIGPERVLPFSHLCAEYPNSKRELIAWMREKGEINYYDRLEYWVLRREPVRPFKDPRTQKAIQLLKEGPWLLPKLLKQVGAVSPIQINVDDLVNQEVIERAGLTPTDLLHVTGEFTAWDAEIARLIIETIAKSWGISSEAFIERARDIMTNRIAAEVIQFLSGKTLSDPAIFDKNKSDLARWLFEESLKPADSHLGSSIVLKDLLVGIGAPAKAFLPQVAAALGTQILLPDHYDVANAVGTVVGNIIIRQAGEVSPIVDGTVVTGYFVRAANHQKKYESFEEALSCARQQLVDMVTAEAINAGAKEPVIACVEDEIFPGMMVHLSAWAVGKPGVNGNIG